MEPEEKGFDYYSSSRTPRKERDGTEEWEDAASVGEGEGEGEQEGLGGERGSVGSEKRSSRERESVEESRGKQLDNVTNIEGEGEGDDDPQSGWEEDEEEREEDEEVVGYTEETSTVLRRLSDRNSRKTQYSYSRTSSEASHITTRGGTTARNGRSNTVTKSTTTMVEENSQQIPRHLGARSRLFQQSFSPSSRGGLDTSKSQDRPNSNFSRTPLHSSRPATNHTAVVNGWECTDPPECGNSDHRAGESAPRRAKSVTKFGEASNERGRPKRKVVSVSEDRSSVEAEVPTDLLCNGPTTSDVQSGRGSIDCRSVLEGSESDEMTVDERGMDCTTEQNSNSKSTRSSQERLTTPHIPSEIDKCVDIDPAKLSSLFERVVEETEDCSVEMMEKMLSTFEHLVFRYRLRSDRRQLNSVSYNLGELL